MPVHCALPECQTKGYCGRYLQREQGRMKRLKSNIHADYDNPDWPLTLLPFCPTTSPIIPTGREIMSNGILKMDIILPTETLVNIMSFLDPKELFGMVSRSKVLASFLTLEMVIRSALLYGNTPSERVKVICKLTSNRSIYPPSPIRLLRLAIGKRCEFCLANRVSDIREPFGVLVCWSCQTRALTMSFHKSTVEYALHSNVWNSIFLHDRVSTRPYDWRSVRGQANIERERATAIASGRRYRWGPAGPLLQPTFQVMDKREYMIKHPLQDRSGENIGPVVTYFDIHNVAMELISATDGTNHPGSVELVSDKIINEFIDDVIEAPSAKAKAYQDYKDILNMYKHCAKQRREQRKLAKIMASQRRVLKKLFNVVSLIDNLRNSLQHPLARAMLTYTVNQDFMNGKSSCQCCDKRIPCIVLKDNFARRKLHEFVHSPSKMNNKILARLTKEFDDKWKSYDKWTQDMREMFDD